MQQLTEPTTAEIYQQFYGPAIFEPCAEHLLRHAAPARGESVLDIACGTGIVTRKVAGLVGPTGRVTGLDLNPEMVRVARTIPASPGAPIEWLTGDATRPDLPDGSFDLIVCQQGLQFFEDRAEAVRQMRRMLVSRGRVAIAAWLPLDRHPLFASMAESEAPLLQPLGVEYDDLVAPFSLPPEELARLLSDAGFAEIGAYEVTIECRFPDPDRFVERMEYAYGAVIPQFVADRAAFDAFVDAVQLETRDVVRQHTRGDHVSFPMHTTVTTAGAF
jgi:ubiquinone/menaquinone biosynthesis C-methylase UbiE